MLLDKINQIQEMDRKFNELNKRAKLFNSLFERHQPDPGAGVIIMRDDPMQGILFSKPQVVRFRQVPVPPHSLIGKVKGQTQHYAIKPFKAAFTRPQVKPGRNTELGNFIDYIVTEEK